MSQNEEWMMKDDESMIDFKVFWGFALRLTDERTNERTDICDCRVAFATENAEKETLVHMGGRGVKIIPFF